MRMTNMRRLQRIATQLPEAERVDITEWGDHPSSRVRGKNFVFCDAEARHLSLKLPRAEAEAVLATDPAATPTGYGLGRHGWIDVSSPANAGPERWRQIAEWVRTSYTLVAPKRLSRVVLHQDHDR